MNNLEDIKNMPGVEQTRKTKTVVLMKKQETYPVYRVPLKYLYYNDQNDRISTEIVRYSDNNGGSFPEDVEAYNDVFEKLVVQSKEDAIEKTQRSISSRGQDNPGVTLKDGRVVDGNRRFTCLRRIQRDTGKEQFFETIILDYDYKDDYKNIKSLELELQMGVDEKVKYDPIDRLFGVYKSIRLEKAFTKEEYAKLFDDYSVAEVKRDLDLADLMCEYLEYQGSPGKYFIAKDMNLEGTLHEIPAILEKVKKKCPDKLDDIKLRIFSSIAAGVDSGLNLFMRDIKLLVESGNIDEYLDETEESVQETTTYLAENPVTVCSDLDVLRSDDDLKYKLVTPVVSQKKKIKSTIIKKAPVNNSKDALDSLNAINDDTLSEMSEEDREALRNLLKKIEDRINDLRSRI